jgi:hypothetical protein
MRSFLAALVTSAATLSAFGAEAQVTGVVTSTMSTIIAGDGFTISPPVVYSGDQIEQAAGNFDTGYGSTIGATSKLQPGLVEFQNGSGSSGRYTFIDTETDVDITFTNNTTVTQAPTLHSQIIAEGFGLYLGGECLTTQTTCAEIPKPYTFQSFPQFAQPGAPTDTHVAGASVEFQILSGSQSLYDLTASTDLVYDSGSNSNVFIDDVAQAQTALSSFQLETPAGSQTAHGFNWGTTDLTVPFPPGTLLAPGQSATLTYRTITRSYSRTDCQAFTVCVIGYSAFGDPIGMSGGVNAVAPPAFALGGPASSAITGLTFDSFNFAAPTFRDGVLTYVLASVPEPDAWGLMLAGFSLVGLSARRRRSRSVADEDERRPGERKGIARGRVVEDRQRRPT